MQSRLWFLSAGLVLSTVLLSGAAETTPAKAKGAKGLHQVLKELHQTHKLLEEADHDYDGHRVKAMKEIHVAIHALLPHVENGEKPAEAKPGEKAIAKPAEKPAKPVGGSEKEPQAVSDAQLKQAITNLQAIEGQLASVKSEHTAKAGTAVAAAIKELSTALSIK